MLSQIQIATAANSLFKALREGVQTDLVSLSYPGMDMDDAYRIQESFVAKQMDLGRKQIGWKIGLTSKAMQNALGIDIPDSGVLLDNMLFNTGAKIPAGQFIQPRVEAEIAFVMKADVDTPNRAAIVEATDYVAPSIEILDTRIHRADPSTGKSRNVFDTISDNAANAGIVLGSEKHAIEDFDLRWVGTILKRNNVVEETGLGAAVLDDPITSILWLAERLAKYGLKIRKGDIVLSGSFIKIVEAPSKTIFLADFGNFGSVEISFA